MNMAELVEFLETKKPGNMTNEDYANQLGISSALLYYYKKGQRGGKGIKVDTVQGIAKYFYQKGDTEALSKLVSLFLGIDGEFTPST